MTLMPKRGQPKIMEKRRLVAVRPRVGSDLERIQTERDNDMADIVHEWAEMFSKMVEDQGEGNDELP